VENPPRGLPPPCDTWRGRRTHTGKCPCGSHALREECCQQGGGLKARATQIWGLYLQRGVRRPLWKPGLIRAEHVQPILDRGTCNYLKTHAGLKVRVGYGSLAAHRSNREAVFKLPVDQWPSLSGRSLWPSSLTINELLEASQRGWTEYPSIPPPPIITRVGVREFNGNPFLAKEIVRRNVVGIRSDLEIPKRYLDHFRYRRNFLILTAPVIPIGLARFLASVWITDPSSLWLERMVSFKKFLKGFVATAIVDRSRARLSDPNWYLDSSAEGGSPSLDYSSDSGTLSEYSISV